VNLRTSTLESRRPSTSDGIAGSPILESTSRALLMML